MQQYMGKKEAELAAELDDVMLKLYEKHVPAPVREYIESREESRLHGRSGRTAPPRPEKPRRGRIRRRSRKKSFIADPLYTVGNR